MYDYFYGAESEQFSFYRIPKVLFTEERFKTISAEAKVLYGLLLDRMSLSAKNGWQDKENRVYIIFTIEDIMEAMGCADQKAGKLLYELESKCGLIERKRQGLGKPNLIYVKNFVTPSESRFLNRENHDSGEVKITDQEPLKSRSNNTEYNNTEFSDTDSFPFTSFREDHGRETKRSDANQRERYREILSENISYEILLQDYPLDRDILTEILELMVDTVCTTRSTVRISGDDKPAEVVKSQFLKLDSEHIRFVMDGLKDNTTRIRNMRQYLLATLYNAPLTIGNYYRSLVSHDMSEGFI
ncbi:MAG: replication initiator protein A [Clostridia bacterium]|nr:replication initiator protein A [Clostridia bacterium]